jgi:dihydroflavonol-4-reductase
MIAVTGATGFLGHNLIPLLRARGHSVRVLARPTSQTQFLTDLGAEVIHGDTRDVAAVDRLVAGCDMVIHGAGYFRFWGKAEDFHSTNVIGTQNVLDAACRSNVKRFIHISTVVVVGAPKSGTRIDEKYHCEPLDDYQRSKLAGEALVQKYHADFGLPTIIFRPGAFYGPYGRYAWNRLFFEDPHMHHLPIQIHGGQLLTFPIYLPDLARVIDAALTRGTSGEIYNVCGPSMTHNEVNNVISNLIGDHPHFFNAPKWGMLFTARLLTLLATLTHREPYYPINLAPYVFNNWIVDSSKAERDLGFDATPFVDGARATIEWYRKIGLMKASTNRQRING